VSWERSFATYAADLDDYAAFQCWDGDRAKPWIAEVQDYVRVSALRHALYNVAFWDEEGELVAASAFDPQPVRIPLCSPAERPGWKLQALAICLEHQGQGHSRKVFAGTFAAMRELDARRTLVTASVHRDHRTSQEACERVGLTLLLPGPEFHTLLGEVPVADH
jgi:hypothetical protein